jgi:hypothetical protein
VALATGKRKESLVLGIGTCGCRELRHCV